MPTRACATCVLCEAACGIVLESEGREVLSVRGDPEDPFSQGYVCPKVVGMKELYDDPDRVRRPLVREPGGTFREASWEEALSRAARGIRAARADHRDGLAIYQGNPVAHNLGLLTVGQAVLRSFGTKNLYSASSADQAPHMVAAEAMFGNPVLMPVPDVDRTQFFLLLGANPLASNGSIMTAPDMKRRLSEILVRGGKVITIDPRRSETAELASEHHFIRPDTDSFLLLGLLGVLFREGLTRPSALSGQRRGWDDLDGLARSVSLDRVARVTGIDAPQIERLARELAAAERATVYGRVGICHQRHGTLAAWLVYALNAVTGNLDRPGGAMFTTPAIEITKLVRLLGFVGHDRWRSRVRGLGEVAGELPVATLADEIETPGPGQVRALVTCAGNPVLSAPNGQRLDRALASLPFMVSVDNYVNETTRHAHVILPPVAAVERSHYDVALFGFSVRNMAKYVPPPIAREPDGKYDWEIMLELGLRARLGGSLLAVARALGTALGPEGLLEIGLRAGPHKLSLARLREHPHGLDLGPLEPRLPGVLETKDRLVDLAPARFVAEARAMLERADDDRGEGEMLLIGRRHLRSNNSWLHNARPLIKGKPRCTLLMHPDDAARLGVAAEARVRVSSRVGQIEAPLELTRGIMPGVVSLPHGFGHDRPGVELRVAREHAGVSVNDLTDDQRLDVLSGNAAFSGVPVRVTALSRSA